MRRIRGADSARTFKRREMGQSPQDINPKFDQNRENHAFFGFEDWGKGKDNQIGNNIRQISLKNKKRGGIKKGKRRKAKAGEKTRGRDASLKPQEENHHSIASKAHTVGKPCSQSTSAEPIWDRSEKRIRRPSESHQSGFAVRRGVLLSYGSEESPSRVYGATKRSGKRNTETGNGKDINGTPEKKQQERGYTQKNSH